MKKYQGLAVRKEPAAVKADAVVFSIPRRQTDTRMLQNKPLCFELGRCWPSPVIQSTVLYYSLEQPGRTTLKIYNLGGQLVKTLVDVQQNAGRYTINFDGMDNAGKRMATGTYVYRLTSGSNSDIKRMILVK